MEMLIITGLSGSGKSKTVNCLEDIGFFCVDNLPPKLISKVAQIGKFSVGGLKKLAVVTDIRGGQMFSNIFEELEILKKNKINYNDNIGKIKVNKWKRIIERGMTHV